MIEVISRSFGISGRSKRAKAIEERDAGRIERVRESQDRQNEKDLFDLARGIAFRARKRRIRSVSII